MKSSAQSKMASATGAEGTPKKQTQGAHERVKGVTPTKHGRYTARVGEHGKSVYSGVFNTHENAASRVAEARRRMARGQPAKDSERRPSPAVPRGTGLVEKCGPCTRDDQPAAGGSGIEPMDCGEVPRRDGMGGAHHGGTGNGHKGHEGNPGEAGGTHHAGPRCACGTPCVRLRCPSKEVEGVPPGVCYVCAHSRGDHQCAGEQAQGGCGR